MRAGKKDDSPLAIFTAIQSHIFLNSALVQCLLGGNLQSNYHNLHLLQDRLWVSSNNLPNNSALSSVQPHPSSRACFKVRPPGRKYPKDISLSLLETLIL